MRIRYLHERSLHLSFPILLSLAIDDPHVGSHARVLPAQRQIWALPCAQPLLFLGVLWVTKVRKEGFRNVERGVDDVSPLERVVGAGYGEEVIGLKIHWNWRVDRRR